MKFKIYNENCITGAKSKFEDKCVDLAICDPPFGINQEKIQKQYNRDNKEVIKGYVEVSSDPEKYYDFTKQWLEELVRILKPNGSAYIVSSWTNYHIVRNVIDDLGLFLINEIIWKYNFGVFTKRKFVTSHYPIAFIKKNKKSRHIFNNSCRYSRSDRENKRSLQYKDMQDVWDIKREYVPKEEKNANKLPRELVRKMVQYSSNEEDVVCDFFLGNFTTVDACLSLNRTPCGFEINKESYDFFMKKFGLEPDL